MTDIRIATGFFAHPKTAKLRRRLGVVGVILKEIEAKVSLLEPDIAPSAKWQKKSRERGRKHLTALQTLLQGCS